VQEILKSVHARLVVGAAQQKLSVLRRFIPKKAGTVFAYR
jgi:hypothetical protein